MQSLIHSFIYSFIHSTELHRMNLVRHIAEISPNGRRNGKEAILTRLTVITMVALDRGPPCNPRLVPAPDLVHTPSRIPQARQRRRRISLPFFIREFHPAPSRVDHLFHRAHLIQVKIKPCPVIMEAYCGSWVLLAMTIGTTFPCKILK